MKKVIFGIVIFLAPWAVSAQSETTQALQKKFENAFSLYFYKNTLRMLNQSDNKEFDEIIKDIEKMKFLMIDRTANSFTDSEYKKLTNGYRSESYEEIVTSRFQGRKFDVYMKDKKGSTLGTVILVNDSTNLYVLDILGTIDVRKATQLFSTIDESSDIGQRIKGFMGEGSSKNGKQHKAGVQIE